MIPDLSIIMASYNADKFIGFALDGVVSQKYDNLEVILIDGFSTDKTLEIVKKYEHILNIKITSEKDNGVNDAFRKGFNKAKGKYICHLCATDGYLDSTWVRNSIIFLNNNKKYSAIFSSGAMEIDENGKPKYMWRPWVQQIYNIFPFSQHKNIAFGQGEIFPDMGWMVKREVFLELFPDETDVFGYGEFNPFLGFIKKLYTSNYKFAVLSQISSYGRHHEGQWGSKIPTETKTTLQDFKKHSQRYFFSLKVKKTDICIRFLSKFLRILLFFVYGGFGYYVTKIRDRFAND